MKRLDGKVAVITGSGRRRGLGEAIAKRLAAEGAAIVLSDLGASRDKHTASEHIGETDEMKSIADEMRQAGARLTTAIADVRKLADMKALADHAVSEFGRLDIWVNNAGIGYLFKPMLELPEDEWRAVIDVNLTGCFFGTQVAAKIMVDQGEGGRIVNIASQAAKSGFPFAQAYCASKHGLVGLTRSAAIELGSHGITVNNVCPNHVTTGLGAWQNEYTSKELGLTMEQYMDRMKARIPLGRTGVPGDTAGAVAFLCSEDGGYITGESMNVSGGEEPH